MNLHSRSHECLVEALRISQTMQNNISFRVRCIFFEPNYLEEQCLKKNLIIDERRADTIKIIFCKHFLFDDKL